MKTLIAVRGVANRGKSASIKNAYALLKAAHPSATVEEMFIGADITVVMTVSGVKVGIESQGDPNSRLFKSLDRFVNIGCKVIICATRTSGKTVHAVNALARQYEIKWLDKPNDPNAHEQEAANATVAREIFTMAQAVIDA